MKSVDWIFISKDSQPLFMQAWEPASTMKAVVCCIHGLGEHIGRYEHVARALGEFGYTFVGFDLRGHGRSGGPRGHAPSLESFMEDIDGMLTETRQRYPDIPVFLYGHSLGGILVLYYALHRQPDLAGVIASAPALRSALEKQKIKVALAKVLGSIIPSATLPSGLDPNTISRDPAVVRAYQADPLVHDKISFGMGKFTLEAIRLSFEHAQMLSLPLLIMHGEADQLGYATGSREFASKVSGDCTLKIWDGLSHELHNEPEKDEVIKFLIDWLDNKTTV